MNWIEITALLLMLLTVGFLGYTAYQKLRKPKPTPPPTNVAGATASDTTTSSPTSAWKIWAWRGAKVAFLLLFLYFAYMASDMRKRQNTIAIAESIAPCVTEEVSITMTVTRDWSDRIRVPLGCKVIWEREETVAYESRDQNGVLRKYPRILMPLPPRKGSLKNFQLRVTDPEFETVEVTMLFSPEGKKESTTETVEPVSDEEEESDYPRLPDTVPEDIDSEEEVEEPAVETEPEPETETKPQTPLPDKPLIQPMGKGLLRAAGL